MEPTDLLNQDRLEDFPVVAVNFRPAVLLNTQRIAAVGRLSRQIAWWHHFDAARIDLPDRCQIVEDDVCALLGEVFVLADIRLPGVVAYDRDLCVGMLLHPIPDNVQHMVVFLQRTTGDC